METTERRDKRHFSGDFSAFKTVAVGLIQHAQFPFWHMEKYNMPHRDSPIHTEWFGLNRLKTCKLSRIITDHSESQQWHGDITGLSLGKIENQNNQWYLPKEKSFISFFDIS